MARGATSCRSGLKGPGLVGQAVLNPASMSDAKPLRGLARCSSSSSPQRRATKLDVAVWGSFRPAAFECQRLGALTFDRGGRGRFPAAHRPRQCAGGTSSSFLHAVHSIGIINACTSN
jgi:hypothetical protein